MCHIALGSSESKQTKAESEFAPTATVVAKGVAKDALNLNAG